MKIKFTELGQKLLNDLDEKFDYFKHHVYHNELSKFEHLVNDSRFLIEYDIEFTSIADLCRKIQKERFDEYEEVNVTITEALCQKIIEIV